MAISETKGQGWTVESYPYPVGPYGIYGQSFASVKGYALFWRLRCS